MSQSDESLSPLINEVEFPLQHMLQHMANAGNPLGLPPGLPPAALLHMLISSGGGPEIHIGPAWNHFGPPPPNLTGEGILVNEKEWSILMMHSAIDSDDPQPTRASVASSDAKNKETLCLGHRNMNELDKSINEFKKMKKVNLEFNTLSELPDLELPDLEVIDLEGNRFTTFPVTLAQRPNLKAINLDGNNLATLPANLELPQLEAVDLNGNNIVLYPEALIQINHIKHLVLSNNGMTYIPLDSFKSFKNLKLLVLSNNPIKELPDLSDCHLLQVLHIGLCELTSIPKWIGELKNLKDFNIFLNNGLKVLPNSIRFVKQAVIDSFDEIFARSTATAGMFNQEPDRIMAMLKDASDRVWEQRRKILCIKELTPESTTQKKKKKTKKSKVKANASNQNTAMIEVLFSECERSKSIRKKIAMFLA